MRAAPAVISRNPDRVPNPIALPTMAIPLDFVVVERAPGEGNATSLACPYVPHRRDRGELPPDSAASSLERILRTRLRSIA